VADVTFKGVWKIYLGNIEAVKELDLDIRDGEFVSLLGPSGCGKSSTLRMVAGLEEITRGELYIGERLVNRVEPGERDVSMVFENYALLPHMSAYDNIAFPLRLQNIDGKEIDKKVREISKLLDLDGILGELAASLGGGERQRVGIGRALIRKSSVLLMDEPISHLDADLRARTRGELARLQKVLGITTVYVTHDQIEALAMADRIAVMRLGELQQYGTADELYNRPANLFVADFVGEPPMNFIPAVLERKGKGVRVFTEGFDLKLDARGARAVSGGFKGGRVWFGVRPKDVILKKKKEANTAKARVVNFEPGCESSLIEAKIGEYRVLIQCATDVIMKEGDEFHVDLLERRFHLFDYESEKSVIREGRP
jgi:multiple sugar transport system ATP-binding protein